MVNFHDNLSSFAKSLEALKIDDSESRENIQSKITNLFIEKCQPFAIDRDAEIQAQFGKWINNYTHAIEDLDVEELHRISTRINQLFNKNQIDEIEQTIDKDFAITINKLDNNQLIEILKKQKLNVFQKATIILKLSKDLIQLQDLDENMSSENQVAFDLALKTICLNLNEDRLSSFAHDLVTYNPGALVRNIKDFTAAKLSKSDINAIAKKLVKNAPEKLANNFKDFLAGGLTEETVNTIAITIAKNAPWAACKNIKDFASGGLTEKNINLIAKILSRDVPWDFIRNISQFKSAKISTDLINTLAPSVAREDPYNFAHYIQDFIDAGLTAHNVNVTAEIVAKENPSALAFKIKDFVAAGLSTDVVKDIAKNLAKKPWAYINAGVTFKDLAAAGKLTEDEVNDLADTLFKTHPSSFLHYFKDLVATGLSKASVNTLIRSLADRDASLLTDEIKEFVAAGLTKENVNVIAKFFAKKELGLFISNINDFIDTGLTGDSLIAIANTAAEEEPRLFTLFLKDFSAAGLSLENIYRFSIKAFLASPESLYEKGFNPFPNQINDQEIHTICNLIKEKDKSLESILTTLIKTKPQERNAVLIWTLYALGRTNQLNPDDAQMNKETINRLLSSISLRSDKETRLDLTHLLIDEIAGDKRKTETLQQLIMHLKNDISEKFKTTLIHLSISLASLSCSDNELLQRVITSITTRKQVFKDGVAQVILIRLLSAISDLDTPEAQSKALEILNNKILHRSKAKRINSDDEVKNSEVKGHLTNLTALLKVDPENIHEIRKLSDISAAFSGKFQTLIPTLNIKENFMKKYQKHFGANVAALILYANAHSENPEVLQALATFLTWAVEDKFDERYKAKHSDHLKILFQNKTLKGNWQNPADLRAINAVKQKNIDSKPFVIETHLYLTIVTYHHLTHEYPLLHSWLKNETREQVINELNRKLKDDPQNPSLLLQQKTITLCQASAGKEILRLTKELIKLCKKLKENEFINDLQPIQKALNPQKTAQLTVIETDNPFYLLTAGEVGGSCQSINGNPKLNKCLTSYLIDGKNRMVALVDKEGNLKARSFIRLLLDKDNHPVLFLERAYPPTLSDQNREMIIQGAIEKARQLGIPLFSYQMGSGKEYENLIYSLGSNAPHEYADAGGGETIGIWSVNKSHIIWSQDTESESKEE
ncbi:MAG: hypothetical protein WDZ27_00070 [Waddliaceae bacterium]